MTTGDQTLTTLVVVRPEQKILPYTDGNLNIQYIMYFFKTLVEVVFYNRTNLLIIVDLFLMCYFFFYLFQLLLNLISTHLQNAVSGAASAPRSPAIE